MQTTRIYCLPSCHPPRKAKPENLTVYNTPEEARSAGYRPCKLCRPDDFYRGRFPEEALVESLVAGMMASPAGFRDAGALASAAGVSTSKLHELFRDYYHTTPADLLTRARVDAARESLLEGQRPISAIAYDAGFESISPFNENVRKYTGMTPSHYRQIGRSREWTIALPADYPIRRMLAYLGRDRASLTERVDGEVSTAAVRLPDQRCGEGVAVIRLSLRPGEARCRLLAPSSLPPRAHAYLHEHAVRTLGLVADPSRFEARVSALPEMAPLLEGQRGLRVPLIADPFDALVWAITGQQITLGLAFLLRRRLIARTSAEVGDGLYAPPAAPAIARLEPDDLVALGFSRAKASYLIGAARAVVDGTLPLRDLSRSPATRIERTLRSIRGIGPWSAQYVLMRSYGFQDCVPVGDVGLTASLQRFFALAARPGKDETLALMRRFSPYRSLATFHLWQRLGVVA